MAEALDGVDIAWIVGLIVSGGVYWLLTRSLDVEREQRAEASSASASWCARGMTRDGRASARGCATRARRARLSLADVEARTGLSKGFLSKVERDASSPSVANLVAICDAVGLAMADLFAMPRTTLVRARRPAVAGGPAEGRARSATR